MALTRQLITANAELASLTDAQILALETLSQNDENAVIGTRIGEIYRQMDATIEEHLGVARNGDEKTYLYLARAAKSVSDKVKKADELDKKVKELTAETERLQEVIKKGEGNAEAAKQLEQAKKDLAATKTAFNDLKAKFDTSVAQHEKETFNIRIDGELANATSGIKFKSEYPESVTSVILAQAVSKVKGMNPEYIDDGKGGKVLVFKDANGARLNNPENALNPYTANELITKELKAMGVLEEGRKSGGGTGNKPSGGDGSTIDLSGCKTQSQAYEAIHSALMAKGIESGSSQYQAEMDKAWSENNISSLPQ